MFRLARQHRVFAFSCDAPPALRVPAGATVELETADCFDDQVRSPDDVLDEVDLDRINPATGPVFVEGASRGDVLRVQIEEVRVENQGVMAVSPSFGALTGAFPEQRHRVVPIADGRALLDEGLAVPLRPMIGVIGVAPEGEPVATATPGRHGGNMDTRLIGPGATLYLPVACVGALFAAGDLHAAMGDGEICGTGVEVAGRIVVRLDVRRDLSITNPVVETGDLIATVASAATLDEAAETATRDMAALLTGVSDLSLETAAMLMSAGGDLQVSQIVDPLRTARFVLPKELIGGLGIELF